MLVDRGQTHRPMAEKEDKRGLQALAERSTGATIDVVPGQVIHYECGTPGVGGATNGAVGAAGGETTFGDLSSAQGPRLRSDTWTR